MVLGVSSYITSAGLKAITSAGSSGPYFAIKYFVPIYNYRTDKTICKGYTPGTSAQSISGLNLVSATDSTLNTQFEKIYRNGNYVLSPSQNFIYNEGLAGINVGGTSNITGSKLTLSTKVNTLSGKPLSPIVSGSTVSSNTSGNFTISNTSSAAAISYNPLSAASVPLSAFYRVTSYSPVSNGITSASGSFKCRIPAGTGSFKFNGLALYGAKVDSHGFDDNGSGISPYAIQPTLFAIALFDESQVKQDAVGGVNDFEIKVNLGFDWTTYNTSGASPVYIETNYWAKMPIASTTSADALSYDGDIVLSSSAVPGSWTPRAKLTITDKDKQQLRIGKDLLHFADFQLMTYGLGDMSATGSTNDLSVLSIDTRCPDDSLLQLGYKTSATALKSIAMGCYAKAYGYGNVTISAVENDQQLNAGGYTTSIGIDTSAGGFASFAIGQETKAEGYGCFAGGYQSVAIAEDDATYIPVTDTGFNFAYGYGASAISDSSNCNSTQYLGTLSNNTTKGSNVAMGELVIAKGSHAVALGLASSAMGQGALSFGRGNMSDGCYSTTIGVSNYSKGAGSLALGFGNVAKPYDNGAQATAIGYETSALGVFSLALGAKSLADDMGSIAIGSYTSDSSAVSTGQYSIALGASSATGDFSTSIGLRNKSTGINSLTIGIDSSATGTGSIAIGSQSLASGGNAVALGWGHKATGTDSIAVNAKNTVTGNQSFVGGFNSSATSYLSLVFGDTSIAKGSYSVLLGNNNYSEGSKSYAIGNDNYLTGVNDYSIGDENTITGSRSMAFGNKITITTDDTIVIGSKTSSTNVNGKNILIGGYDTDLITIQADTINAIGLNDSKLFMDYSTDKNNYIGNGRTVIKITKTNKSGMSVVTGKLDINNTVLDLANCILEDYSGGQGNPSVWVNVLTGQIYLGLPIDTNQTDANAGAFSGFKDKGSVIVCVIRNINSYRVDLTDYIKNVKVHVDGRADVGSDHAANLTTKGCVMFVDGKVVMPETVSEFDAVGTSGPSEIITVIGSVHTGEGNGNSRIQIDGVTLIRTGYVSGSGAGQHDGTGGIFVNKYMRYAFDRVQFAIP